jgi:hypothetical protein
MPLGVIALLIDGIMTAAVGFGLLHKLNHTVDHVEEQIEEGVQRVIDKAPELIAEAFIGGDSHGSSQA